MLMTFPQPGTLSPGDTGNCCSCPPDASSADSIARPGDAAWTWYRGVVAASPGVAAGGAALALAGGPRATTAAGAATLVCGCAVCRSIAALTAPLASASDSLR